MNATARTGHAARGNFVVLRAGALRLLLPHAQVGPAEYMQAAPQPSGLPGLFEDGPQGARRTVIALSPQMRPLPQFPAGRFVLTRLLGDGAEGELSFAWDEVRVLIDAALQPRPLPPAMRRPGAPIDGYVALAGELLLCTTAQRVLAYAAAGED